MPTQAKCTYSGAYEPPKAAKEHETQFHDNPNYVTTFAFSCANGAPAVLIEVEVETN